VRLPIYANWQRAIFYTKIGKSAKTLIKQGFPQIVKFSKTAKPIGKHWQTNTATLLNFVL
jgi:hypothetical protein